MGWGEGVVADDGLDGNIEIECQGRDGPRPFAVSMLSLLNLMQFVVIAFGSVYELYVFMVCSFWIQGDSECRWTMNNFSAGLPG